MKSYARVRVSLLKIKGIYTKQSWSHFKLNGWNIQSIFHWKWIRKNQFSILKNRILNQLGILCKPQNIRLLERPYFERFIVHITFYSINGVTFWRWRYKLQSVCIIYKNSHALNEVIFFGLLHFWGFLWSWKLTFIEHWMNFSSPILFPWWVI